MEWLVKLMVTLVVVFEVDVFRTQTWSHGVSNCAFVRTIPETSSEYEGKSNEDWLLWKSGVSGILGFGVKGEVREWTVMKEENYHFTTWRFCLPLPSVTPS
jgi:hypothetical protein